ncbi:hypothetical protein OG572_41820 [Streptomyces virginiae]|uniref:Uncharacterized protein n=1 Tax=Streptomyces virginiae TaxID=1961 RepID=A0ABZ1TRY6_STRVG|nr:hypothetical protein [Streptomyces virginiae]
MDLLVGLGEIHAQGFVAGHGLDASGDGAGVLGECALPRWRAVGQGVPRDEVGGPSRVRGGGRMLEQIVVGGQVVAGSGDTGQAALGGLGDRPCQGDVRVGVASCRTSTAATEYSAPDDA